MIKSNVIASVYRNGGAKLVLGYGMKILGISCYYHDSAAALVIDGKIIAAAQEERFTRKKHDASFPQHAIRACLEIAKLKITDIDYVVFYEDPRAKFMRLIETYLTFSPKGLSSFLTAMPIWLKQKLFLKSQIRKQLAALFNCKKISTPTILFREHHQSHAASAFYPSPFKGAAVLCMDGVGEKATTSAWLGRENTCTPLWEINFPHSLGLLYSSFTYHAGFKVNSGEYKLMGLAPYGTPRYVALILDHLIDLKADGSFNLNMRYFDYATGFTMTNHYFDDLFGQKRRLPESELTQFHMDMASSIQKVTEEIVIKLVKTLLRETKMRNLCLAGGVALNCVANGRILKECTLDDMWIQPAAGDAGGALGAALSVWYEFLNNPRLPEVPDAMQGAYLGTEATGTEIKTYLDSIKAPYVELPEDALMDKVADLLQSEAVVGWFQGRMEFGPRALGARSILGDARSPKMQSIMNLKIKYRESFRPFAPAVMAENTSNWFDIQTNSPYMLLVANVKAEHQYPKSEYHDKLFGIERLNLPRSTIPAVTHIDYSARIQTVHKETNPRFYQLINAFKQKTGCPVLINTSFNVRGEPIVCTPQDAYRCFMRTEMDYLVLENILLAKATQPKLTQDHNWRDEFQLD